jgi:DNA polymerase-3 subunit gamma/tau
MPAEVLYRKWRPQRFADVSGQEAVKRTLSNALKNGKVSHAYLFAGPRGTGKTTMGRLLTKAINCEQNSQSAQTRLGEPCNECASCVAYNESRALDLVELDGASNRGIDEIRKLRENAGYAPMAGEGAHKVYLIDEVHMLTDQAFNALLKTLEEPPPHIVFILATTDAHRVPATITSRCQRQDFKRIPVSAIVDRLAQIAAAEGMDAPREGLEVIARASTGSLRDAINLLEQVRDSYGAELSVEMIREGLGMVVDERTPVLVQQALRGDLAAALATVGDVRDDGADLRQFQREVVGHLRELLLVQAGAQGETLFTLEQIEEMKKSVEGVPQEKIVNLLKLLSLADLKQDPLSPLPIELALAESMAPPPAARQQPAHQTAAAAAQRTAPQRPSAPPTRVPEFSNRPRPQQAAAGAPPAQRPQAANTARAARPSNEVPSELRKENITGASAEDIARMVGRGEPVIPPPTEAEMVAASAAPADEHAAASAPANGNGAAAGSIDLATFVDVRLRPAIKETYGPPGTRIQAVLNGTCHAISWADGVLTLGFYGEGFPKKAAEGEHRQKIEDVAAKLLGGPASLRCIIAAKPARALKSPLVQHAVENRGAKIVSEE